MDTKYNRVACTMIPGHKLYKHIGISYLFTEKILVYSVFTEILHRKGCTFVKSDIFLKAIYRIIIFIVKEWICLCHRTNNFIG